MSTSSISSFQAAKKPLISSRTMDLLVHLFFLLVSATGVIILGLILVFSGHGRPADLRQDLSQGLPVRLGLVPYLRSAGLRHLPHDCRQRQRGAGVHPDRRAAGRGHRLLPGRDRLAAHAWHPQAGDRADRRSADRGDRFCRHGGDCAAAAERIQPGYRPQRIQRGDTAGADGGYRPLPVLPRTPSTASPNP